MASVASSAGSKAGTHEKKKKLVADQPVCDRLSDFAKRELKVASTGQSACCKLRATGAAKQYKIPSASESAEAIQLCDVHGSVYFDAWSHMPVEKYLEAFRGPTSEVRTQIEESVVARKDGSGVAGVRQNYKAINAVEKTVKVKTTILNHAEFQEVVKKKPLQEFCKNRPTIMVPKISRIVLDGDNSRKHVQSKAYSDSDEKVWICKYDHSLASYRSMSWKIRIGGELEDVLMEHNTNQLHSAQGKLLQNWHVEKGMSLPQHGWGRPR